MVDKRCIIFDFLSFSLLPFCGIISFLGWLYFILWRLGSYA
jgi:hypothetical protein